MAHINNLAYTNDETCIEANEGFLNATNYPNPSTETQTRTQLQKMLSQSRKYINDNVVTKINAHDDTLAATVSSSNIKNIRVNSNAFEYSQDGTTYSQVEVGGITQDTTFQIGAVSFKLEVVQ